MTIVTPVKPAKLRELSEMLCEIGNAPEDNSYIPFRSFKRLHFASLVLDKGRARPECNPCLIFENNFDGPLETYLDELCERALPGLRSIYTHCEGFPSTEVISKGEMVSYLRARVVWPLAYHVGNTGRTVQRILDEQKLRDTMETQTDELVKNSNTQSANELRNSLQEFVRKQFPSMCSPVEPRQTSLEKAAPWIKIGLLGLLALVLVLIWWPWGNACFVLVVAYAVILRWKESKDTQLSVPVDAAKLKLLVENEDRTHSVQNHLANIAIMKPGWIRHITIVGVLWAINLLARAVYTQGKLGGIPSIHFAHWSLIDNGKRLLFLSNFDGSWESYLDDFIDKAHSGLTAVWSNTVDFPRTRFLVFGGATDGPRFKAFARDNQVVTNAWYSAYRDLTVQGINKNSNIRERLFKSLDERATRAWLQQL